MWYNSADTIRLAGIIDSISNGPGMRLCIFVQGCPHHCPGCHNEHTWDPDGGCENSLVSILDRIERLPKWYGGITLSGGEPFDQEGACYFLAKKAKEMGFNVWTYTGYIYEDLCDKFHPLLHYTDTLIDGPFVKELRGSDIPYVGSSNQRIINLKGRLQ